MFGIFNAVTDAVENGLDILGGLAEGETPTKRQLAKLISDGVSIYTISEATGIAVDVLESIVDSE